jgi:hypothetical protein
VRGFTRGSPSELGLGLGLGLGLPRTVGNSPTGLPGLVPVPKIGGNEVGGSVYVGTLGLTFGVTATTSVAEPWKDSEPFASALANASTCSPSAALEPTFIDSWSSSTWPMERLPTLHEVPLGTGQTVKLGLPMYSAQAVRARTVTSVLAAFVVQTQTANVAAWPALTSDELVKDCTRTHSCGVLWCGGGEDVGDLLGVGLGDGLGLPDFVVGDGLGLPDFVVGEALGLAEWLGVADGLLLADGLEEGLLLADGLEEGLLLADGLEEGLLLADGLADGLLLAAAVLFVVLAA